MTKPTPIIPGLTFVLAVAALVLALWPVVSDAPWEDGVTSSELSEILRAEQETSSEDKETERVAKYESVMRLLTEVDSSRGIEPLIATDDSNRDFQNGHRGQLFVFSLKPIQGFGHFRPQNANEKVTQKWLNFPLPN